MSSILGVQVISMLLSLFFFSAAVLLSVQILFGMIGWTVMRRLGYFADYVWGDKGNAGTFSLICPGVAFFCLRLFLSVFRTRP